MISTNNEHYIVAGSRPWNHKLFTNHFKGLSGRWTFTSTSEELSLLLTEQPKPRYIFFLHWSNRVPDDWLEKYECVCFHMTDLPYGRGGSPLQNLIQRGHRETMLTALRMVHEMDAGPVYAKRPLSLEGNAEEIYLRAGRLSFAMISDIISNQILPKDQIGEPVNFKRRTPEQSQLPVDLHDLMPLHDFIRMLDAEGYPQAFIDHGAFRIHFSRAALYDGRLVADAKITLRPT
jgi:methionyl-tRNA formyltransferase